MGINGERELSLAHCFMALAAELSKPLESGPQGSQGTSQKSKLERDRCPVKFLVPGNQECHQHSAHEQGEATDEGHRDSEQPAGLAVDLQENGNGNGQDRHAHCQDEEKFQCEH